MTALFLTRPGIVSSLGIGLEHHISALLAGEPSPLTRSDKLFTANDLPPKKHWLGEINRPLRPFPADLPKAHHSRNNQILWDALGQIHNDIQQAVSRFGRERIAVVIGTSTTGVDENLPIFKYAAKHNDWSQPEFNQQQQYFSAPADFIAHQYGLKNLVYGISTACTSGVRALISAARLLRLGVCDAVICGGVDTLSLLTVVGFNSLSVLSSEHTNPLSANRNGINLGEGAAVFIMTREMLHADDVRLLGYGASSDAYHMSSPHPQGEGAIQAFHNALQSAGIAANDVGWINLHGTGTIHNDAMELLSVHQVFGDNTPCTTTKPYTGHTLGAAGAIEAAVLWGIISRKMNPNGNLPPQQWDKIRDGNLPMVNITDTKSCWPLERRIGASSSFAFGGNNAVIILGE